MEANDPIHQNSNFLAKRGRPHMDFRLERSVIDPAVVELGEFRAAPLAYR